jgi:acetyl esterase
MTLDPDVRALLEEAEDAAGPPTLERRRAGIREVVTLQGDPAPVAEVRDVAAGDVPVRLYYPAEAPGPVLVWAHSGGWVAGDLDTWDVPLTNLAHLTGAVIASVDYRLAPETRFPGALEDMLSALRFLAGRAAELRLDASRIAVGGDSAGGNLAAATALAARDLGGPRLAAQVMVYPPLDPACATGSHLRYAEGYEVTRQAMLEDWERYLPTPYAGDHPYAAPLRARGLAGLPPAVIATAEYDPLRDDGELYAARLAADGVPVWLRRFDGMIHSFFHHNGRVPASRALPRWLADRLRPLL